eukprot:g4713.t1
MEHKTQALFTWLFGFPIFEVCLVLCSNGRILFTALKQKALSAIVPEMQGELDADAAMGEGRGYFGGRKLEVVPLAWTGEDQTEFTNRFNAFFEEAKVSSCCGMKKETHIGEFAGTVEARLNALFSDGFEDLRPAVSQLLSVKAYEELQHIKTASVVGCAFLQRIMIDKVTHAIDRALDLKNLHIREAAEDEFEHRTKLTQWEARHKFTVDKLEYIYASCQSGKEFDIRPTQEPGLKKLRGGKTYFPGHSSMGKKLASKGPIILSLGLKYTEYCASITRTLLIDPSPEQKQAYVCLLKSHAAMMDKMRTPNVLFSEVYEAGKQALPAELQSRFVPNVGFSLGLEFRDALLQISPKSERRVLQNMVLCLSCGLQVGENAPWALWFTDTLAILPNQKVAGENLPVELTQACKKSLNDILFELEGAEEEAAHGANGILNGAAGSSAASSSAAAVHAGKGGMLAGNLKGPGAGVVSETQLTPMLIAAYRAGKVVLTPAQQQQLALNGGANAYLAKNPYMPPNVKGGKPGVGGLPQASPQASPRGPQPHPGQLPEGLAATNLAMRQGRTQRACAQQLSQHMQSNQENLERQRELRQKKTEELRQRFRNGYKDDGSSGDAPKKKRFDLQVYKSAGEYPDFFNTGDKSQLREPRVLIDTHKNAVLLPINGVLVAFAIKVVKSMSVSQDETDKYCLRIVFYTPGGGGASFDDFPEIPPQWRNGAVARRNGAGADDEDDDERPAAAAAQNQPYKGKRLFIKELTFKAAEGRNFENVAAKFKDAQKQQRASEQEQEALAGIVEQEPLKLLYQRQPPCLRDIHVRPILTSRKASGRLEGHLTGLRFIAPRNEFLDILYSNIAHAVFEPCLDSVNTVLHFNLKHEIVVNKKRTKNVQFFCEVLNMTEDLSGKKPLSFGDERQEEERERTMVNKINQVFRQFIEHVHKLMVEQKSRLQFEYPYQNLKFRGVHHRSNVVMMPTIACIVALQEWPAFCLPYKDIELAVFERFTMELKEFDLIFIPKDYRAPVVKISAIPNREYGERIKSILSHQGIVWYTYDQQMRWPELMKQVISDIRAGDFQEGGCWDDWFGQQESDEVNALTGAQKESDSDGTESQSEFKPDSDSSEDDEFNPESEEEEEASDDDEYPLISLKLIHCSKGLLLCRLLIIVGIGFQPPSSDGDSSDVIDLDDVADSDDGSPQAGRGKAKASGGGNRGQTKVGLIGQKGAGKGARPKAKAKLVVANPILVRAPKQNANAASSSRAAPAVQRKAHQGRAFK